MTSEVKMEDNKNLEEIEKSFEVNNGHNENDYDASQIQILEGLEAS